MAELIGCGSHNCLVVRPEGQGTNGPCTCPTSRFRIVLSKLRARLEALEQSNKSALEGWSQNVAAMSIKVMELEHTLMLAYQIIDDAVVVIAEGADEICSCLDEYSDCLDEYSDCRGDCAPAFAKVFKQKYPILFKKDESDEQEVPA